MAGLVPATFALSAGARVAGASPAMTRADGDRASDYSPAYRYLDAYAVKPGHDDVAFFQSA
jgi:hypothetical protein